MLAFALSSLFAVATVVALASLADSYVRGWNAFRSLRRMAGEQAADARVSVVSLSNDTPLPGMRRADVRSASQRLPSARPVRVTRVAA